jgi:hypothetical protein
MLKNDRYVLDENEQPVECPVLEDWLRWIEHRDTQVEKTQINDDVFVSTIFLTINHRHAGDGPPIVFETMVFGGKLDGVQKRYCTVEDARKGHWDTVELAKYQEAK